MATNDHHAVEVFAVVLQQGGQRRAVAALVASPQQEGVAAIEVRQLAAVAQAFLDPLLSAAQSSALTDPAQVDRGETGAQIKAELLAQTGQVETVAVVGVERARGRQRSADRFRRDLRTDELDEPRRGGEEADHGQATAPVGLDIEINILVSGRHAAYLPCVGPSARAGGGQKGLIVMRAE